VQDGRLGCGHANCVQVLAQGPDGLKLPHQVRGQYVGDCPNLYPILLYGTRHATGRKLRTWPALLADTKRTNVGRSGCDRSFTASHSASRCGPQGTHRWR
jgi:hypothetical protein